MQSSKAHLGGTASAEKCLDLLRRILADGGNSKLADVAKDMQLPQSTMYRLLGVLERAGFVARDRAGHFGVGLTLLETLQGVSAKERIVAASRPLLARLAADCGATAHLGVLENDMVTYLVKAGAGDGATLPFTRENAQLEAYCTGIGKVLLAWLPAAEQASYLANGPFVRLTDHTITEPVQLAAGLKAVRAERYATDNGEIAETLHCVAVPLWTEMTPMTAAISLSFQNPTSPGRRISDDLVYVTKLRNCAKAISRRLGRR